MRTSATWRSLLQLSKNIPKFEVSPKAKTSLHFFHPFYGLLKYTVYKWNTVLHLQIYFINKVDVNIHEFQVNPENKIGFFFFARQVEFRRKVQNQIKTIYSSSPVSW